MFSRSVFHSRLFYTEIAIMTYSKYLQCCKTYMVNIKLLHLFSGVHSMGNEKASTTAILRRYKGNRNEHRGTRIN